MYLVILPVAGSSLPMWEARFPAYQTVPVRSTIRLWGFTPGSSSYRLNSRVAGTK